MSLPEYVGVAEAVGFAVDCAAADNVEERLGRLKCTTRLCESPNTPLF
jgi:hypothetical protein